MIRKTILALCIIPALVAGMMHVPAAHGQAQTSSADAGVGIQPLDTNPTDPNGGQWFFKEGSPGQTLEFKARLVNLATVERTVKMYLADLNFSADGTPQIPKPGEASKDIGTWGGGVQSFTLPANKAQDVTFKVTVPTSADPGDHVGAVVIENPPQRTEGQAFNIVKRVSTRLYVTVPGDANPAMRIESVKLEPDSSFFPRETTLRITLRNTGTIGLRPSVFVNGEKASGPELMLTKSIENYVVTKKVPLWGGPQSYRVDVTSLVGLTQTRNQIGPVESARVSKFYFPYVLLIALVLLVALFFLMRRWLRNRSGKYAAIRADMKRIERMLAEQRSGVDNDDDEDPELAIKAAIKRAGRAGDKDAEEQLKEKLAEHRAAKAPVVEAAPPPASVVAAPPPAPLPPPAPEPVVPVASAQDADAYDWLKQDAPADHGPADAPVPELGEVLKAGDPPAAEPPRVPVQSATGPGYFVPDPAPAPAPEPTPEPVAEAPAPAAPPVAAPVSQPVPETRPSTEGRDEKLSEILRELATAPKRKQEPLIQAARAYGVLTLRAHGDLIEQLPADVRAKLVPKRAVI